jgi:hypothetical protein
MFTLRRKWLFLRRITKKCMAGLLKMVTSLSQ